MTNEEFLEREKTHYESLKDFKIINNFLTYSKYAIPLENLSIEKIFSFCPGLFNLEPTDIIKVIYSCKLLSKPTLTNEEINYLNNYTDGYLNIKKHLTNNIEYKVNNSTIPLETLERDIKGLELPILFSDNEAFINSIGAKIIREKLDIYYQEMDSGLANNKARVRKKNGINGSDPSLDRNYLEYEEFHERLNNYQSAGFITIFLIAFTVVTTMVLLMMIK